MKPFDIEVINESSSNHELMMALQKTRDTLRDLVELTMWMTGSNDFQPEGRAWRGWLSMKGSDRLRAAHDLVGKTKGDVVAAHQRVKDEIAADAKELTEIEVIENAHLLVSEMLRTGSADMLHQLEADLRAAIGEPRSK